MDGVVERPDFRQEAFFYPFSICVNWIFVKNEAEAKRGDPQKDEGVVGLGVCNSVDEERLALF